MTIHRYFQLGTGSINWAADSQVNVGTPFYVSEAAQCIGTDVFAINGVGAATVQLYDGTTQALMASARIAARTADGWIYTAWSSPVSLTANMPYVVNVHHDTGGFPYWSWWGNWNFDDGPLIYAEAGQVLNGVSVGGGKYAYNGNAIYPGTDYSTLYGVGPVVEVGAAPPAPTRKAVRHSYWL